MGKSQRQKQAPYPNTFLIGVQKAGTTSLNRWLSQHPGIYCYNSLKDIPLFVKFPDRKQLNERLLLEKPAYRQQPAVLHSAVNYIFYKPLLHKLSQTQPHAKLILILRNPVTRAISSYFYFKKMLREKRDIKNALIYQPKKKFEITPDNNDFTYIEHGFYYQQVKECLEFFSREQLLVLDYEELKNNPLTLLQNVCRFLNIDENFKADLTSKNITGKLKNKFIQQNILTKNASKKWVIDNLVDPWLPVNKRIMLKNKMLELNTAKNEMSLSMPELTEEIGENIKSFLAEFYITDSLLLDELLATNFHSKWFEHEIIQKY